MDSPGPTPEPTPEPTPATPPSTPPPTGTPVAPATATEAEPTAAAATPDAPRRRGFFGPAAPSTPEQRIRGRLKAFGFAFIALGVFLLANTLPVHVAVITSYPELVKQGSPGIEGGNLDLQFLPGDGLWNVTLQTYDGNHTRFASATTNSAGAVHFADVDHALATLVATHMNVTIQGAVFAPPRTTTALVIDSAQGSQEWFGGEPTLPLGTLITVGLVDLALVLVAVAGIALILRRWRILVLIGCIASAAFGALVMSAGDLLLGVAFAGMGIWALITVRKNPGTFQVVEKPV